MSSSYSALAEFRFQIRRFLHFSEQASVSHGLEPQQHQLMLAVKGLPEDRRPTIRAIADRLLIAHHSAIGLVQRMEKLGVVRRRPSEDDRREVLVELTAYGERVLKKLSDVHEQELQVMGPELIRALQSVMKAESRRAS